MIIFIFPESKRFFFHVGQWFTTKNTVISPNFLVWKFCGKAQFPNSFGQIAQNYAETVPFHKISKQIRRNYGILRKDEYLNYTFLYKQPVYKQLALGWQIVK